MTKVYYAIFSRSRGWRTGGFDWTDRINMAFRTEDRDRIRMELDRAQMSASDAEIVGLKVSWKKTAAPKLKNENG